MILFGDLLHALPVLVAQRSAVLEGPDAADIATDGIVRPVLTIVEFDWLVLFHGPLASRGLDHLVYEPYDAQEGVTRETRDREQIDVRYADAVRRVTAEPYR